MQGRIIKGIAGFYYVYDVVESVIMNVKQKEFSVRRRLNHWSEIW